MPRKKSLKNQIKELININKLKIMINNLGSLIFYAVIMGLLINYSLWAILHLSFKWYTFPAYGIILYFLKSEFIYIVRWCFHKIPGVEE